MKMSQVISVLIVACLIFSFMIFPICTISVNASEETEEIEKIYCDATLEDTFTEKKVCVIIHPDWYDQVYTVDDFAEVNCVSLNSHGDGIVKGRLVQLFTLTIADEGKQKVLDAVHQLETRADIYAAQPNYLIPINGDNEQIPVNESEVVQLLSDTGTTTNAYVPNDPMYANQWGLHSLSLPQAWTITTGSPTVYVGVLDSGIQGNHPDLVNRINTELSACFLAEGGNPLVDSGGHGTRMAGVIGAEANNQIGISGVCWNVQLVSLKVGRGDGYLDNEAVYDAIEYAQDHGIWILNYSAGKQNNYDSFLESLIHNYAGLFVCSAGNNGADNDEIPFHPADYDIDNILVVGASKAAGLISDSSNYGATSVDVFAPGDSILSTTYTGGYSTTVGTSTSLATAYVSGVAALILSAYPDMNASQIKQTIIENTYPVYNANGENIYAGKCVSEGIVNAYDALQHDYTYASDGVSTHKLTCVDCGYACTEEHSMIYESVNAIRHTHKCELCEYSYLEKHTLNYVSISTDKHLVTCQTCGYSAQQNHMMTYTADDLGNNHTGTCTVCNDSFIESHSWTYEYVDTNKHNHVCEECGYSELQNHMESYTATTSLNVHTTTCFVCNQTYNETHTWADMGSYYQCTLCLKTSTSIPGVLMNATGYELTDGQTAVIDSNTILCCIDGEYFLVKAETETEAITYLIEEGTQ